MAALIKTVTFDCADALAQARFWAGALGSDVDEESTSARAYVEAAGWGGPNMWFARVPSRRRLRTGCISTCGRRAPWPMRSGA
jgi:hypothetical protein